MSRRVLTMMTFLAPALLTAAPLAGQPAPASASAPAPDSATAPDSLPLHIRYAPRTRLEMDFASGPVAGWHVAYTHYALHARMLLPVGAEASVGLEIGRAMDLGLDQPRVQSLVALVRLPAALDVSAETGLGIYWAGPLGAHPGFHAAVLWHQPFTKRLDVPIGLRMDAIFSDPMVMPVTLTVGVGFRLRST